MEADSRTLFSAASRRYQSALQSRFDAFLAFEKVEGGGEDDLRAEFACPVCSEDFDIFGLCCHIEDQHPEEAKNGVCPLCTDGVGIDMVSHITMHHGSYFKMQQRRKHRKNSSNSQSTLSFLKKELHETNLHTVFGGSSFLVPSADSAPDPLLSSFIISMPSADPSSDNKPSSLDAESLEADGMNTKAIESVEPVLSQKDQEERAQRSAFSQELLLSTIFL